MASAACMKIAGVPVEFSVATILFPMIALFPMPVTMTRPLLLMINSAIVAKLSSIYPARFFIACVSVSIILLAKDFICS